jgi:RNA polymerase sigma-70 factor, ECF subfamily
MTAQPDTEELVERAAEGDVRARQQLLGRHRERLLRMVAVRIDPRLSARVDPSDVVQEALAEAAKKLDDYLRERPLPFYPWLRQLAWDRLVKLHRRHIRSKKRSITREELLSEDSVQKLAKRVLGGNSHASEGLVQEELRERVKEALALLDTADRELLVMRNLEQLSVAEIAAVLGITEGAVKVRHLRALRRLRGLLEKSD